MHGVERILEHFSDWKILKITVGGFLMAKDNLIKMVKQKRESRKKRAPEKTNFWSLGNKIHILLKLKGHAMRMRTF